MKSGAQISSIDCTCIGIQQVAQTQPSTHAKSITVDFSNARSEFWFKRANGSGLYYTLDNVVVRVRGALQD